MKQRPSRLRVFYGLTVILLIIVSASLTLLSQHDFTTEEDLKEKVKGYSSYNSAVVIASQALISEFDEITQITVLQTYKICQVVGKKASQQKTIVYSKVDSLNRWIQMDSGQWGALYYNERVKYTYKDFELKVVLEGAGVMI